MQEIEIDLPDHSDGQEIRQMLDYTIRHTFAREGITLSYPEELDDEINSVFETFTDFLDPEGHIFYFIVARCDGRIVGTTGIGETYKIVRAHFSPDHWHIPEFRSTYIHPDYQGLGIAKLLVHRCLQHLQELRHEEFFLAGGYTGSIPFWERMLGVPTLVLKDYWNPGHDHLIWRCRVDETKAKLEA